MLAQTKPLAFDGTDVLTETFPPPHFESCMTAPGPILFFKVRGGHTPDVDFGIKVCRSARRSGQRKVLLSALR